MNHRKSIVLAFSVFSLLWLASAASGNVGVFEEKGGADNLFNQFNSNGFLRTSPALGDLTGDEKLEAVIGYWDSASDGKIGFFTLNASNQYESDAAFSLLEADGSTPISGFGTNIEVKPTLWDWDGDGNLDLFVGTSADTGKILYFQNNGSNGFVKNDDGNPFKNISNLGVCKVTFGDFSSTKPGFEALVGTQEEGNGTLKYFELEDGFYVEKTSANPASNYSEFEGEPKPFSFLDDKNGEEEGLFDLFIGTTGGRIPFYRNGGTASGADFSSKTSDLKFEAPDGSSQNISFPYSDPVIVKYDGDNRKHLFVGSNNQGILYFVEIVGGPGDYNDDGDVDLNDAILALKIVAGVSAEETINLDNRISGEAIGIEEAIYALRVVAADF